MRSYKPLTIRRVVRKDVQEPLPFCGAGGPPDWLCCSDGLIYCHLNKVSYCPRHNPDPEAQPNACCRHARTFALKRFSCKHHTAVGSIVKVVKAR